MPAATQVGPRLESGRHWPRVPPSIGLQTEGLAGCGEPLLLACSAAGASVAASRGMLGDHRESRAVATRSNMLERHRFLAHQDGQTQGHGWPTTVALQGRSHEHRPLSRFSVSTGQVCNRRSPAAAGRRALIV